MNKRAFLALLLGVLALWLPVISSPVRAQEGGIRVYLDAVEIPLDVPGQIQDGRTMVPFRAIFEALGAKVEWDPAKRMVSAERGDDTLVLTVDSTVVEWRRSLIRVDAAPVIVEGRTLVPLRFVAQALGLHVVWDGENRSVYLEANPADAKLAQGIRLVKEKGCMVCHKINGSGGQVGPNLGGVVDRYGEAWMQEWLRDPQAMREGSRMPNFKFTEAEIEAVVEFLKTVK